MTQSTHSEESRAVQKVGDNILVTVTKITLGKDNKMYLTISHPLCSNNPTLIWKKVQQVIYIKVAELDMVRMYDNWDNSHYCRSDIYYRCSNQMIVGKIDGPCRFTKWPIMRRKHGFMA